LTSVVGKLLESIIQDHILDHFFENNLFSPYQHGFLPKRSCVTQILSAIEIGLLLFTPVDIVYFDFHNAFDSVPYQRFLLKLCAYGIQGDLLQWLSDFLIGRKQKVMIGNETSSWCDVKSGVPQGSVLGPILFAIYVNYLPQVVECLIALLLMTPYYTTI